MRWFLRAFHGATAKDQAAMRHFSRKLRESGREARIISFATGSIRTVQRGRSIKDRKSRTTNGAQCGCAKASEDRAQRQRIAPAADARAKLEHRWYTRTGSNRRPTGCKPVALPLSYSCNAGRNLPSRAGNASAEFPPLPSRAETKVGGAVSPPLPHHPPLRLP